jgi:hypothetical protein
MVFAVKSVSGLLITDFRRKYKKFYSICDSQHEKYFLAVRENKK